MVSWTCPYCGKSMHSVWDKRTDEVVVCIHCDGTFKNPCFREGVKLLKQCRTCRHDWDGHCTIGYDNWKQNKAKEDDDCGEYEERRQDNAEDVQETENADAG